MAWVRCMPFLQKFCVRCLIFLRYHSQDNVFMASWSRQCVFCMELPSASRFHLQSRRIRYFHCVRKLIWKYTRKCWKWTAHWSYLRHFLPEESVWLDRFSLIDFFDVFVLGLITCKMCMSSATAKPQSAWGAQCEKWQHALVHRIRWQKEGTFNARGSIVALKVWLDRNSTLPIDSSMRSHARAPTQPSPGRCAYHRSPGSSSRSVVGSFLRSPRCDQSIFTLLLVADCLLLFLLLFLSSPVMFHSQCRQLSGSFFLFAHAAPARLMSHHLVVECGIHDQ